MKRVLLLTALLLFAFGVSYSLQSADSIANIDSTILNTNVDSLAKASSEALLDSATTKKGRKSVLKPPSISEIVSFGKIFWAIVFLTIGYFVIRFLGSILGTIAERSTNYRITIKGITPIVKIFAWIFVLFVIIAGIFQPPISTVLAVTASVGIAVGFAAQDILKNIFGGVMILFDRPFLVGDKIEVGSYYGEVVQIGLRSTRIITPDDSNLMNTSVSNANSGEANCQVVAEIYLPLTVDTQRVRQIATESAQVSRYIYLNKPIAVLFFNEVKERRSYIKMRLKAYVSDIRNEFAFKSDMTEIVIRELLKEKLIRPEDLS